MRRDETKTSNHSAAQAILKNQKLTDKQKTSRLARLLETASQTVRNLYAAIEIGNERETQLIAQEAAAVAHVRDCNRFIHELRNDLRVRERIIAERDHADRAAREEARDHVRVLRLVEYDGSREAVEKQIRMSVHGSRPGIKGVTITAVTLHEYPLALEGVREASRVAGLSAQFMAWEKEQQEKRARPVATTDQEANPANSVPDPSVDRLQR